MALDTALVTMSTSWSQTKAITGFNSSSQSGPFSTKVTPTLGASNCNRIYFVQGTLASGATVTIDLRSLSEQAFNESLTVARIYSVHVKIAGATGQYRPGAADPLVWPFADSSDILSFVSTATLSDSFAFGTHTGQTVSATVKNVRIVNNHGSDTLTYTAAFLLGV